MTASFDFAPVLAAGLPAPAARWTGLAKYSFVGGNNDAVGAMVGSVKLAVGTRHVKAILETGELPDQRWVMRAAELSIGGGADEVMLQIISKLMGTLPRLGNR